MTRERNRILVVGLGSIGRRHARLLSERDDVELLLCDCQTRFLTETQAQLAGRPSATFDNFTTALLRRPEIVFLCTPTSLHAAMAHQALEAGCDLFIEKPIAVDSVAALGVCRAAGACGRILQVGYMLRYEPGLRRVQALVAEGAIGEIVGARTMIGTYLTLLNSRDGDRERVPYSLLSDYTHEFDFLQWILGPVQCVSAASAQLGQLELRPDPNVFQALLRLESGALVQVHLDYVQFPQRRTLEIYGDHGTITYDLMDGRLQLIDHHATATARVIDFGALPSRIDDVFRQQFQDLLESRAARRPPLVDGWQALPSLQVVDACIESITSGRWVTVPRVTRAGSAHLSGDGGRRDHHAF